MRSSTTKEDPIEIGAVFIGIDNGPSGSIGIQEYSSQGMRTKVLFLKTPTYMMQDYQKKAKRISQLDLPVVRKLLRKYKEGWDVHIAMERPLVNSMFFNSSIVAVRVHQSWLDVLKNFGFPAPQSLDSREWQKPFLPKGTKGKALKKASRELANKKFPKACPQVKHPDCDGMLICEWVRMQVMGGMPK